MCTVHPQHLTQPCLHPPLPMESKQHQGECPGDLNLQDRLARCVPDIFPPGEFDRKAVLQQMATWWVLMREQEQYFTSSIIQHLQDARNQISARLKPLGDLITTELEPPRRTAPPAGTTPHRQGEPLRGTEDEACAQQTPQGCVPPQDPHIQALCAEDTRHAARYVSPSRAAG